MALSAKRSTQIKGGGVMPALIDVALKANAIVYQGGMVATDATGYGVAAGTSTSHYIQGVAISSVDNTGGANGAKHVQVRPCVAQFANSAAADEITVTEKGSFCYIVDDETVAKTTNGGTRSRAGTVIDVDSGGVWVAVHPYGLPTGYATTTGVENLTNKTLVTPTIASFTNATHDHSNAAGGGQVDPATALSAAVPVTLGGTGLATVTLGDLLYSDANDSVASLGVGTAYQGLKTNAGATAPEWSSSLVGMLLDDAGDASFAANDCVIPADPPSIPSLVR